MYKLLLKLNNLLLPSFTRRGVDISKAKKWQLAILAWRYFVLRKSLK